MCPAPNCYSQFGPLFNAPLPSALVNISCQRSNLVLVNPDITAKWVSWLSQIPSLKKISESTKNGVLIEKLISSTPLPPPHFA